MPGFIVLTTLVVTTVLCLSFALWMADVTDININPSDDDVDQESIMAEYKYYRAMSRNEYRELCLEDQYGSNLRTKTYWTNSYTAAADYCSEGRIIVEIVLDKDIPQPYHSIALGVDDQGYINNHHEVVLTREQMNDQLINALEMQEYEY